MNALGLAFCLAPGQARLPLCAVIDIGPSSSGLISLVREALPPERRHEAGWFPLRMTAAHAINPCDTQLGCRAPLPAERAFLVNLLSLMVTPAGAPGAPDGMRDAVPVLADLLASVREPDALGALARAVANPWRANRNRADAGHDLAFGQVAVAHQPSAAFFGARLGVAIKERRHLRLDRPRQQGPGAAAQYLGQRIGKRRWPGKLQNGIVTHGVSLLRWRSGGSITPTIRRLNPSPRHQLLAIAHWARTEQTA